MSDLWLYLGALFVVLMFGAVFFGAPYVPMRRRDMDKLFQMVGEHDVVCDLGSGDGRLVKKAAACGLRAYGVELSPLLVLVSRLSLWRFRRSTRIFWGNYWRRDLPPDTTVVVVFLAEMYMKKLRRYIEGQAKRLGHPVTLISYGFELPGHTIVRQIDALVMYQIKP